MPREIWSTQFLILTEALAVTGAMPEDIEGIGITNQRETTIVWNVLPEYRYTMRLSGSVVERQNRLTV